MYQFLIGVLGFVLFGVLARFTMALGIGFVTLKYVLPNLLTFISAKFTVLPIEIMQIAGMLRIDIAMTMILSAAIARAAYKTSFLTRLP